MSLIFEPIGHSHEDESTRRSRGESVPVFSQMIAFMTWTILGVVRPRGSVVEQLIRNEQIVGSIPTEGSTEFLVGTTGFEPMAFRPPA